ncbi:MAG TPA: ATP-binding protein, partial [Myxococcaceae bacterium]|nr:ATP-binding protein [Myxococcaceae bacterium]
MEDDPDLREGLADLLRSEGYDVACASNGAEALTSLRSGQAADLIVLDLMMPTMDGWEFRMHQKRDPALASIPVMAITADDSPKAGAIDATFVLRKPFQLDELLKSLHAVMKAVQAERLAQTERLASVGRLAAGLAHEINNPLAYVLSNLRILSTQWIPKLKQAEGALGGLISADELSDFEALVRESLDGGIRIEGIVRDIQVHTSAREDAAEVIDLRHALDSALKIAATRIRPRARVVRDYKDLPPVLAHPIRIGQVLLNILVNAADAVPEGSPEVQTIRVSTFEQNGRCVVEIADSGSGMPSSVLPRIFDPFFTTKPVGSGTGLGLFICQGIVLSLGGEITVESQVGKGTVFRVSLPVHLGVKTPSPPPVDAVRQPAAI